MILENIEEESVHVFFSCDNDLCPYSSNYTLMYTPRQLYENSFGSFLRPTCHNRWKI